jgi:hypothetical protein
MTTATDTTVIASADGLTLVATPEPFPVKSAEVEGTEQALSRPRLVCCWCTPHHVIREGPDPVSHGACPIGVARFEAGATA